MINIQATRQQTDQAGPDRQDYEEKEDRRRRFVPLIFLLIVGSCTAYLKSFLPTKLSAPDEHRPPYSSNDEEPVSKDDALAASDDEAEEIAEATKSSGKTRSGSISASLDEDGTVASSTDISAQARMPQPKAVTGSSDEPVRNANDNRAPPRQDAPGNHGGGGGGGPDKPTIPRDLPGPGPDLRNRAPRVSGPIHLPDVVGCHTLAITIMALLAGATDPDGDNLTVVGLSTSSGTLTRTEDGGWEFEHERGMLGEVTLTYAVSDGRSFVVQTASFNVVEAPPIVGTEGDDNLLGTKCADTIIALGGSDNIDAREGNDKIFGGNGDDHILAGAGDDVVYAGAGDDIVFAGAGNDIVFGGAGNDRLFGEAGNDTLYGEDGADHLEGGAGRDILLGGSGNDLLQGDEDDDTLEGGEGDDQMSGGTGNDVMAGGAGNDVMAGNAGNDTMADGTGSDIIKGGEGDYHVLASADATDDTFEGGAGADTLDYSSAVRSITVDLGRGQAVGEDIGHDAVAEFENIVGGSGDDTLKAAASAASIDGGAGNDVLTGSAGDDDLRGNDGNDIIADGDGSDIVRGGDDNDRVVASADAASDEYDGNAGWDTLDYSATTLSVTIDLRNGTARGIEIGEDLIAGFEEIIAGSGDDRIVADSASVTMTGGAGRDIFEFQRGSNEGPGHDQVRKITDFTVGDRIVAANYQIILGDDDDDAEQQIEDLFEQVYSSEGNNGHGRAVRFRFEDVADGQYTAIDVADRPDPEDVITIEISGHHQLQFAPIHS